MSECSHAIALRAVSKSLVGSTRTIPVLTNIELGVAHGEFVALVGPGRSGKSVVLNLIGGLETADAGTVTVLGQSLETLDEMDRADWRMRNVGYVFQFFNLIPALSLLHNVMLPLTLSALPVADRERRARGALELVGLGGRELQRPCELPAVDQQRVAIARAIVMNPRVLLCDEPTGNLEDEDAQRILALLQTLHMDEQFTIVLVTRNEAVAAHADRVVQMNPSAPPRPDFPQPQPMRQNYAAMSALARDY
ncbi:ABC transporter ATP-binding protein [Niveibacterium sp. SC-1]|uniref:ABC transporter ATP-binding protein n=1 Tax=Niveibacterium sp. SC-1 TaxID=3135646 RepID=UPI00311DDB44